MTQKEFLKYLSNAKNRVQKLRKSKPGVSLCFDTQVAERAYNAVRNAKRMMRNAREEQGISYEDGGLDLSSEALARHRARIESALIKAGV